MSAGCANFVLGGTMTEKNRIDWIDGLKGVCSVWVLLLHYLLSFYPNGYVGWNCVPTEAEKFDYYFDSFPYSLLTNGPFVLFTFFALIAFLPAYQYFSDGKRERIQRQAKVRYFRLMPAILFSCVLSWAFFELGLYRGVEVSEVTGNPWISAVILPNMTLPGALFDGLIGAHILGSDYTLVIWCMDYIFLGSYLAYATLLLFGDMKNRAPVYIAMLVFGFLVPWTISFTAGIAAADVLVNLKDGTKGRSLIGAGLMLFGFAIGKFPSVLLPSWLVPDTLYGIGNFFFIIGIALCAPVVSLLSKKPFRVLGKYSFSIMLCHPFVLLTVSSMLFLHLRTLGLSPELNTLICIIVSLPLNAIAAFIVEKTVGTATSWLINKLFKKSRA